MNTELPLFQNQNPVSHKPTKRTSRDRPRQGQTPAILRFGPGGTPLTTTPVTDETGTKLDSRTSGLYRLHDLNLNHMEVEFVYGVNIQESAAKKLGAVAKKFDITLTAHGPYYINLASDKKPTYYASIDRVKKTLIAASWMNGTSITFHPAFYQGADPEQVTGIVKQSIIDMLTDEKLQTKIGTTIPLISLETTGKPTQWGSLDEVLETADAVNQKLGSFRVSGCIDFAHIHARSNGGYNSRDEFNNIIDHIEKALGANALHSLHIHLSGINYSHKGERKHLTIENSDLKYKEILEVLKERRVSGWVVCESPNLEEDATRMKQYYESLP